MIHQDLSLQKIILTELNQLNEEGYDIQNLLSWKRNAMRNDLTEGRLDDFWIQVDELKERTLIVAEPSDLESIQTMRPGKDVVERISIDKANLLKRIHGAWLGRCAGCTLGKPVEGWPREKIKKYLTAANSYPLRTYIPAIQPLPAEFELHKNWIGTTRNNIAKMVRDDDIDYTILNLKVLESAGRNFSTRDVGRIWLENFPFYMIFTAEAIAYRNLVNEMEPPQTALFRNPYREYIGAQIRADMWGYINPGNPKEAAEFAFRDACLSHAKNGIYGEMWASACIAAAFLYKDPLKIIECGLKEIPAECRLSNAIERTILWTKQCRNWEDVLIKIDEEYGIYDPIHVIPNTCVITAGLLMGEGDFARTLCITLMGGHDTDCTCATVGSIMGILYGAQSLPAEWIEPLNDHVESVIKGFEQSSIHDLAERTLAFVPEFAG